MMSPPLPCGWSVSPVPVDSREEGSGGRRRTGSGGVERDDGGQDGHEVETEVKEKQS